jgi:hypothetical protein
MYRIAACKLGAKVQMYRNAPYQNGRKGTWYQNAPSRSGRNGTGNEGTARRQRQAMCRFDGGGREGNGKDALAEEGRANGKDRRTDKAAATRTTGGGTRGYSKIIYCKVKQHIAWTQRPFFFFSFFFFFLSSFHNSRQELFQNPIKKTQKPLPISNRDLLKCLA